MKKFGKISANVSFVLSVLTALCIEQTPSYAHYHPLTGDYVVEAGDCGIILSTSTGIDANLPAGTHITIDAEDQTLFIKSASPSENAEYPIGTFDDSGPVSDGPATYTNKYSDEETSFSSGEDNVRPGDNFGQLVIEKTANGLSVTNDGSEICQMRKVLTF